MAWARAVPARVARPLALVQSRVAEAQSGHPRKLPRVDRQWRAVRARPAVVARLRLLSEDDDPWVREAARLAAQPEDAKW